MLRVRTDGALLGAGAAARPRRASAPTSPATPPTSPTGRTSSTTGSAIEDVPDDLGAPRGRRAEHARGLRRLARAPFLGSPVAGVAKRRDHRRHPGARGDQAPLHRQPGVLQPARASSRPPLTGHPSHDVRPRDQRRLLRRHRPPRARPRLRPLGRRRAVHQPDARPEARRLDPARRGGRRLGGRHLGLPRLRLPPAALAGPAEVPGRRLGRGEVPRGARDRVPRPHARRLPLPAGPDRPAATTSACTSRRTAGSTSALAPTVGRISGTMLTGLGDLVEEYGAAGRPAHGRTRSSSCSASTPDRRRGARRRPRRDRPLRPARRTGAAPRWPAPASSSASSRSSTPSSAPRDLVAELEQRFPDLDTPITVNVNGCPNACARTQVADIGLKGQLVLDDDGHQVEGFQVHLGGGARARPAVRQEAARAQGHQRRPRRLRHHRRDGVPRPSATTASPSPPGSPGPTRTPLRGEVGSCELEVVS